MRYVPYFTPGVIARRLRRIVEPAAGVAAAGIGDDRAAGGEMAGERAERVGVTRPAADQHQRRAGALRAVVDRPAGHCDRVLGRSAPGRDRVVAPRAAALPRPATSRGWRL